MFSFILLAPMAKNTDKIITLSCVIFNLHVKNHTLSVRKGDHFLNEDGRLFSGK